MNALAFALLYGFFSLLFVFTNLEALQIPIVSSIGSSVNQKLRDAPFSLDPRRKLDDIASSTDIYHFLRYTLVPVLYSESANLTSEIEGLCLRATTAAECNTTTPTAAFAFSDATTGDPTRYCEGFYSQQGSTSFRQNMTAEALQTMLMVNGNPWQRWDLLKWCQLNGASNFDVTNVCHPVLGRTRSCKQTAECPDPRADNAVIEYLDGYAPASSSAYAGYDVFPANVTCPGFIAKQSKCCSGFFYPPPAQAAAAAEAAASLTSAVGTTSAYNVTRTPVRLAGYNEILLLRFTLKRHKFERSTNHLFKDVFPWLFAGRTSPVQANADNGARENQGSFVGPKSGKVYTYENGDGHAQSGGYVVTLDPSTLSEHELRRRIEELYEDGWFDLQQASFTVDFLVFNGNRRQFLLLGYSFSVPFSGLATRKDIFKYVSLDNYNNAVPGVTMRVVTEVVVYILLVLFVILEIKKAQFIGIEIYFAKASTYVNNVGLLLSWIVVALQLVRTGSAPSFTYLFSTKSVLSAPTYAELYTADEEKAAREDFKLMEEYLAFAYAVQTVTAINLTVVFGKAVVLVSDLSPYLALISNVLGRAFPYLVYFTGMYFIIFGGFVLLGYFLFGQHVLLLSSLSDALIYLFALCCGGSAIRFDDFTSADPAIGPIYVFMFYLVMIFTLMNVFLSILLGSYDIEKFELERRIAAGTTTNAVADAMDYVKRQTVQNVLIPLSDGLRAARVAIFGPRDDDPLTLAMKAQGEEDAAA
ncbi:unnamed protein product, partial [Amoebophrya sp. A120]|eukprot:GSA120T00002351001.1